MKMQPILAHLRHMSTDDYPVTEETKRRSLEAAEKERKEAEKHGVFVDAAGRAYLRPAPPLKLVLPFPSDAQPSTLECELAASIEMPALVDALIAAAFALEGWGQVDPSPVLRMVYEPAAVLAVRYSNTDWRTVAKNCATTLGESKGVDAATTKAILDTYLHHLTVGVGRSEAEWAEYRKLEVDDTL